MLKVESVARGLEVLRLINYGKVHGEGASLGELAAAAGLSRGTTYRILYTLQSTGYVVRNADGRYDVTRRVRTLSHGYDDDWISAIADPVVRDLGKKIMWPLSVSEHVGGAVVVRLTTDKQSPLVFNVIRPGYNMSMLDTASGRVLLAYSSPEKQATIMEYIVGLGGDRAVAAEMLGRNFAATGELIRQRGYDHCTIPQVRQTALAVPVRNENDEVIAALGVRYFSTAMSMAEAVRTFLEPLQQAARQMYEFNLARKGRMQ